MKIIRMNVLRSFRDILNDSSSSHSLEKVYYYLSKYLESYGEYMVREFDWGNRVYKFVYENNIYFICVRFGANLYTTAERYTVQDDKFFNTNMHDVMHHIIYDITYKPPKNPTIYADLHYAGSAKGAKGKSINQISEDLKFVCDIFVELFVPCSDIIHASDSIQYSSELNGKSYKIMLRNIIPESYSNNLVLDWVDFCDGPVHDEFGLIHSAATLKRDILNNKEADWGL